MFTTGNLRVVLTEDKGFDVVRGNQTAEQCEGSFLKIGNNRPF